jgi:hypothetical protein
MQLVASRPYDVIRSGKSERYKEQAGLVDMAVVPVDNGDFGFPGGVDAGADGLPSTFHQYRRRGPQRDSSLPTVNCARAAHP